MTDCPHNARIQENRTWRCMNCNAPVPPGCDMMVHQPDCGHLEAKEDARSQELVRLRERVRELEAAAEAPVEDPTNDQGDLSDDVIDTIWFDAKHGGRPTALEGFLMADEIKRRRAV